MGVVCHPGMNHSSLDSAAVGNADQGVCSSLQMYFKHVDNTVICLKYFLCCYPRVTGSKDLCNDDD